LHGGVGERVAHLFRLKYYDTAIREACVQLEHDIKKYVIKKYVGLKKFYGDPLVEAFSTELREENRILESNLRTLRQELRTVFNGSSTVNRCRQPATH
jgi:hypothetical protein